MATFVYAPAIRVHIESLHNGIIDVSDDITTWQMTRRSNTVSSFNFTLQNAQRKYDQVFRPGDRITVDLKRITWVKVFTGSLNNGPVFSAWPRALPMTSSCSLKKLQFWPWDPTRTASQTLITKWLTTLGNNGSNEATVGDGGLSALITSVLVNVTNWAPKSIHIGQVPNDWLKWAQSAEQIIAEESDMQAVLGTTATINGKQIVGKINVPGAGNYGGTNLDAEQLQNAASIYAVILANTGFTTPALQDRATLISFMTVMQESRFINLDIGDRDSVGLFQQRPSQGWGTAAECENITHATTSFLTHLLKVPSWSTIDPAVAAQSVQNSGDGSLYSQWFNLATALVQKFRSTYNGQVQTNIGSNPLVSDGIAAGQPSGATSPIGTGNNMAAVANQLIQAHLTSPIIYDGEPTFHDDPPNTPIANVKTLDCSSLVQWCYYNATGGKSLPRDAAGQQSMCDTFHLIPVDLAANIQGALLFIGSPAHHVGVSLGNGDHVAAHDKYSNPALDVNISPISQGGGFTIAGLLPTLDYTNAATTQAAADQLAKIIGKSVTVTSTTIAGGTITGDTTTGSGTTNSSSSGLENLVQAFTDAPAAGGDIFGGSRALIDNQPILPWITSLTNSSMRSFCSAPNGDFIAWFPDYFNVWKTAAIMKIRTIELQDFTVDWSDQQIVTHEFVIGTPVSSLDTTSGSIVSAADSYSTTAAMYNTKGIAVIDFPGIFKAIYNKPASEGFIQSYLSRFGARPNLDQMPNINIGSQEFYMALWNFMYYWAAQFTAQIPMTFMPELYPGMIIQIPEFDFQAYVTEVAHQGSYGQNGQFTTMATIVAPARTSSATDLFGMLPLGG